MKQSPTGTLPLAKEHPQLYASAEAAIGWLNRLQAALSTSWAQHFHYLERAHHVADHLTAAINLATDGHYPSAFVVIRTALEQSCIDELLLRADRYSEHAVLEPADYNILEAEWNQHKEDWTLDVVDFTGTLNKAQSHYRVTLVRKGHDVTDSTGAVVEHVSPYDSYIEDHDAMLGTPSLQDKLAEPFANPDALRKWARRSQDLYKYFLSWSAIVDNLKLNGLLNENETLQLEVHYRFLSAFTHATGTCYKFVRNQNFSRLSQPHLLGELVLLYANAVAVTELKTFLAFVAARPTLVLENRLQLEAEVDGITSMISYLWFPRLGAPVHFDHYEEANRRANDGGQGTYPFPHAVPPEKIPAAEVGYYRNPLKRLEQLHHGSTELATGFSYPSCW